MVTTAMGADVSPERAAGLPVDNEPRSARERLGEWFAAISILLAVVGMAISSPPLVGPDEGAHQATASYLTVNVWPPESETREYVSGMLVYGDCALGFNPTQDASCVPGRDSVVPVKERILNYPPPYYWVVGLGQKFAPGADSWMDVGGRLASLLLNLAGLSLLAVLLRRHVRSWGTYLLAISTPMAAFLWAVVNPNGWEITAGLIFAYVFAQAWWRDSRDDSGSRVWVWSALVALAAVAFALSRHDALVWLSLLVVAIIAMGRGAASRVGRLALLVAAGVGVIAGLLWQITHAAQHTDNNPDRVAEPQWIDYLHWLGQIDEVLPDRLRQMVGVLGWLDTPAPQWLVLLLLLSWGAVLGFLFARTRIPVAALGVGFFGIVLVPGLLEVLRWNDWPYWYQGRITLSFAIPFLFLLLLRFGDRGRRAVIALSSVNALALAAMLWLNLSRYSFGIADYLPERWSDPAVGGVAFWSGVLCIVLILGLNAMRVIWLADERRMWLRQQRELEA